MKKRKRKTVKRRSRKIGVVFMVFGKQGCPFGGSHSLMKAKQLEKEVVSRHGGKTSVHRIKPTDTYAKILKKQGIDIRKWS